MVESFFSQIMFSNWKLKIFAVVSAVLVWFLVNNTITETATIRNVPVRIVNLPPKMTVLGLKPNGYLANRMTLTLRGTKRVIDELEPGDLEVLLEGSGVDGDEWNVKITKNNLISLNPSVDLSHHIREILHPDFVIKLNPIVAEKVPIYFMPPTGQPPNGYEFLDIWPQQLAQSMTGSQDEIESLKVHGLQLTFDLSAIRSEDLESLKGPQDEISYLVPNSWKRVAPVKGQYPVSEINDPEAKLLRLTFLKKGLLAIGKPLPIIVHYPVKNSSTWNPKTFPLEPGDKISNENGMDIYTAPLFIKNVSRLFLETVLDNLAIVITVIPNIDHKSLPWSLEVINPKMVEENYVAAQILELSGGKKPTATFIAQNEPHLRKRFKEYLQNLALYDVEGKPLIIKPSLSENRIILDYNKN